MPNSVGSVAEPLWAGLYFDSHREVPMPAAAADVFHLPTPPTFATADEERRHRKQRLAAAFRLFSRFGFDEGVAGHITARDPERLDHFWVNPFGMHFGRIRASDLILVNLRGEVVEGRHDVNVAAFAIHSQVHAARPEVVAATQAHSTYGKAWSSLGRLLDPITQDACAFYEDHALRRFRRRGVRNFGRRAHREGARGPQGDHPAESRIAHSRSYCGRGSLVVHHDGSELPCATSRRSCRATGEDRTSTG